MSRSSPPGDEPVVILGHAGDVQLDPAIASAVARATRLVATNARLQAEVRAQVRDLRASRLRLLAARDAERTDLERRLEAGLGPRFTALRDSLRDPRLEHVSGLGEVLLELEQAQSDVAGLCQGVIPLLGEHGLDGALRRLAARMAVPVSLEIVAEDVPSAATSTALLFVASEALTNITRHASCDNVLVRLTSDGEHVSIAIDDDGAGGATVARGSGLQGLRDRVEALGGRFTVASPPGAGTHLVAQLPLDGPAW
jgi:signal transduction histidine kinase